MKLFITGAVCLVLVSGWAATAILQPVNKLSSPEVRVIRIVDKKDTDKTIPLVKAGRKFSTCSKEQG